MLFLHIMGHGDFNIKVKSRPKLVNNSCLANKWEEPNFFLMYEYILKDVQLIDAVKIILGQSFFSVGQTYSVLQAKFTKQRFYKMVGFVGVHSGAGQHADRLESKYQLLCRKACRKGIQTLNDGGTYLDAAVNAAQILEDSPLTNAGLGSNLTYDGRVECDAGVMDGKHHSFGACGAVSGVKNPVLLARTICDKQRVPLSLGRVPPCVLVGHGAHTWAKENSIVTVDPSSLISEKSLKTNRHCKRKLARYESLVHNKSSVISLQESAPLDTIGAVAMDNEGNIAAACSSGGVILKYPGRVGQAAVYGSGCWADETVGIVTSGCGEYLILTNLARETARNLETSSLATTTVYNSVIRNFIKSPMLSRVKEKLAGMLVLQCKNVDEREFLWAHTTSSMCIGYMTTDDIRPVSRMSRLPAGTQPGTSVLVEGIGF